MSALAAKQILVTGATGTVGSAVVARLALQGARVRAMARRAGSIDGAETVVADLADAGSLARAVDGCDVVVHCAAEVSRDAAACRAGNVDGVRHLVTALGAARRGARAW